jgi:hypothetical protein
VHWGLKVAARLGKIIDRYAITLLFTFLGLLNAQSWPFLLPFVAFGAAIDIWLVRPSSAEAVELKPAQLTTDEERRRVNDRFKKLYPLAIGCSILGVAFLLITTILEKKPQLLGAIAPTIYSLASPFIALLRNHYQDLLAHGFPDRAHLVAVNYAGLYLLFYVGLGLWLAKIRSAGLPKHLALEYSKRPKLGYILCLVLLVFLLLGALHFIDWVDINYNDERFGRRHQNTNIARYDSLFWGLAFFQGAFGFFLPALYSLIRSTPRLFGRREKLQTPRQ